MGKINDTFLIEHQKRGEMWKIKKLYINLDPKDGLGM